MADLKDKLKENGVNVGGDFLNNGEVIIDGVKQKTEQELAEEFSKEYEKLCDKYGLLISFVLKYVQRDDGTFSTVVTPTIMKLNKNVSNSI